MFYHLPVALQMVKGNVNKSLNIVTKGIKPVMSVHLYAIKFKHPGLVWYKKILSQVRKYFSPHKFR